MLKFDHLTLPVADWTDRAVQPAGVEQEPQGRP